MKKRTVVAVIAAGFATGLLLPLSPFVDVDRTTSVPQPTRSVAPVVVEEDEPGWDCKTMGNKICGPTPTP